MRQSDVYLALEPQNGATEMDISDLPESILSQSK